MTVVLRRSDQFSGLELSVDRANAFGRGPSLSGVAATFALCTESTIVRGSRRQTDTSQDRMILDFTDHQR